MMELSAAAQEWDFCIIVNYLGISAQCVAIFKNILKDNYSPTHM